MNAWFKSMLLIALVLTAGMASADVVVLNLQEYGFTSPSHTVFGTNSSLGVPVSGSNTDAGTGYSASASAASGLDGLHASVNVSTDGTTAPHADAHAIMALDVILPGCGATVGQSCGDYVVWTVSADGTATTTGSGLFNNGLGASANNGQVTGGGSLTGGTQAWTLAPAAFLQNNGMCVDGVTFQCSDSSLYLELALNGSVGMDVNAVPNGLPGTAILNYTDTATVTGNVYDANGNLLNTYFFGPSTPTTSVPEPSSMMLLGSGVLGVLGLARRRLLG